MKDATHHLKSLQRKILQAARKSEGNEVQHMISAKLSETKWDKKTASKKSKLN